MAIDKIQSESINLADNFAFTGTVTGAGNTPDKFFQAYHDTAQSISTGTLTKLNYATELFDTDSKYDTSTSRYTPGETGKYLIGASVRISGSSVTSTSTRIIIKKNGSGEGVLVGERSYASAYYPAVNCFGLIDVTSASDYFEVYHYQRTDNTGTYAVDAALFFWGVFYGYKVA
jgi:hypothetical protein